MRLEGGGWWSVVAPDLGAGDDYSFAIDGGDGLPDPRSAWQPQGVLGPSRLVDHGSFAWHDDNWRGVPVAGRVLYELHIGTFTPEGTFDAAALRLPDLVEFGIDVIELMPVAAFDGDRGWGYDGVALYAVHEPYGGPEGLKRFVDAAHRLGLGVALDVVYNHLGPSGNVLGRYGPYFTGEHQTPWGSAVNLDGPGSDEVRAFLIDNALAWLRDYHVDGLRLDAVHALADDRATHVLEELAIEVQSLGARLGRAVFLIAEYDRNDPRLITSREAGGYGLDAQWCDDVHHAIHATLTGERQGYYCDFGSLATLGKALSGGFVHDGTYSAFRERGHGRPFDRSRVPGHRLVAYAQTHDQVGNRATGERISSLIPVERLHIAAALVLTSAFTPMIFMGEEWGASTPWQYFASFADPQLSRAVTEGRRAEFADHGWDTTEVPDPVDPATAQRSILDWAEREAAEHAELLDWHRRLIRLRREMPDLADGRLDRVVCSYDEAAGWFVMRRGGLAVVVNLAPARQPIPVGATPTGVLLASAGGFVYRDGEVEIDADSVAIVAVADRPVAGPHAESPPAS